MIVGVCDTDPVAAGLIAHYLSVAFNVLGRTEGINARVGVLEPFTLTDPSQVGAIGEAPMFGVIDASVNVTAYVSLNGFGSTQVEQRIARDGVANVCLTEYLADHDDDTVVLADACIRAARDLAKRFSAV